MNTRNWTMPRPPRLVTARRRCRRGDPPEWAAGRRGRRPARGRAARPARAAAAPGPPWAPKRAARRRAGPAGRRPGHRRGGGAGRGRASSARHRGHGAGLRHGGGRLLGRRLRRGPGAAPARPTRWAGGRWASGCPPRSAPAAAGHPVLAVCGDGGLMMALGELATLVQERLPVTVLVVDDGGYGMLRYDQVARRAPSRRRRPARPRTSPRSPRRSACRAAASPRSARSCARRSRPRPAGAAARTWCTCRLG